MQARCPFLDLSRGVQPVSPATPAQSDHSSAAKVTGSAPGLLLARVGRPRGRHAAGDLRQRLAVHRAADHRPGAGHVLPADRAVAACDAAWL